MLLRRFGLPVVAVLMAAAAIVVVAGYLRSNQPEARPRYRAVMPGFCQRLPFDMFFDEPYRSSESIGLGDTMQGSCFATRTSDEPEPMTPATVVVSVDTFADIEQARDVFTHTRAPADTVPVRLADLDGTVDGWRAYEYKLQYGGLHMRGLDMFDRNAIVTLSFDFLPGSLTEQRLAALAAGFAATIWTSLRDDTHSGSPARIEAPESHLYGRLAHGFSPRWDVSALEAVLGKRSEFPRDFRNERSTMVGCELKTGGDARISLYVRYFDSAQQAADFFAAHLTVTATPRTPQGALAEATAVNWLHRPPAPGHDGLHLVTVVDNNAVVMLQVTARLADDRLVSPVIDSLNAALALVRSA